MNRMSFRHFEKKGGLFRRIESKGSTLSLALGRASEGTERVSVKCASALAARRLADTWSRWALEAGFAEIPLEEGTPGVLFFLSQPRGPGRVRDDEGKNVYFEPEAAASVAKLAQGQRVLLQGVRERAKLRVEWMFGSRLAAEKLVGFQATPWNKYKQLPDPSAKIRAALAKLAGPRLEGWHVAAPALPKKVAVGTLIFAYEKGVHRFLGREPGDDEDLVHTEPVLTSKLTRQSGPPQIQVVKFCAPLPEKFRREAEKRFGLGVTSTVP
jgi:hypothetical protein